MKHCTRDHYPIFKKIIFAAKKGEAMKVQVTERLKGVISM